MLFWTVKVTREMYLSGTPPSVAWEAMLWSRVALARPSLP